MSVSSRPEIHQRISDLASNPGQGYLLYGAVTRIDDAQLMARLILCPGNGKDDCATCHRVSAGVWPDLIELTSEEGKSIGVGPARELVELLSRRPYDALGRRVILIPRLELLTRAAQNALLKLIEEPPVATVVIATTDVRSHVLPTIVSRLMSIALTPDEVPALSDGGLATQLLQISRFDRLTGAKSASGGDLRQVAGALQTYAVASLKRREMSPSDALTVMEAANRLVEALVRNVAPRVAYERLCLELPC